MAYGGAVGLFTVTPPGRAVIKHTGPQDHLQADRAQAKAWNASESERWAALHRKAAAATRRKYGSWKLVGGIRAYQRRGLIHRHLLLPGRTPSDRAASEFYAAEVARRAKAHGFGFVKLGAQLEGRNHKFLEAVRAQGYLVKYVVKESAGRLEVLETVTHPDTAGRVHYLRPGLSPWTMYALRRKRLAHRLLIDAGCEGLGGHEVDSPERLEALIEMLRLRIDLPPPANAVGTAHAPLAGRAA